MRDLAHRFETTPGSLEEDLRRRALAETDRLISEAQGLWTTLTDFRGADLHAADLTGNLDELDGVRWSSATRWPAAVREDVERHSIDGPSPGEFVLRFGVPVGRR